MNSIAEFFANSNCILNGISKFFDKYIGSKLLRKCGIKKIVDQLSVDTEPEYADNPILHLVEKMWRRPRCYRRLSKPRRY